MSAAERVAALKAADIRSLFADLADHPASALRAITWWFQLPRSRAGAVFAAVKWLAAAVTVGVGHRFFASALIGIFRSFNTL